MQKLLRSFIAIGAVAGLAACGDKVTVPPAVNPPTPTITGVNVAPTSTTISVGQTVVFSAALVTTGDVTNTTVTWSSNNTAIATVVAATGAVTGVSVGQTTIKATAANGISGAGSVTVQAAAPNPNALQSLAVTPGNASLTAGQTLVTSTIATTAAGATVTYANTSGNIAVATVTAAGANPTITAVAAGTAVITITASGSGTGLTSNAIAQAISVTVSAQAPALTSLTVTPNVVNIGPGGTLQLSTITTTASGANAPTFANTSNNAAVATVTAVGANPTITAVGNGSAIITITATATGTGLATNSLSQAVTVNVAAASVSIAGLTMNSGPPSNTVVPVNLAGVAGQVEANLNLNSGNQTIDSVAVFIDGTEAASQIFGVNGAPNAQVSLSVNTATFRPAAAPFPPCTATLAAFAPCWTNGTHVILAKIFPHTAANPTASNTISFTLTNADVVYFDTAIGTVPNANGLNHTGNFAAQAAGVGAGTIWWKGGFTWQPHPVLYSGAANVASVTYTSTACGAALAASPTGAATFTCAGVESAQNIADVVAIVYVAGYTLTLPPTIYMDAAQPAFVPGNTVFTVKTTHEDNVGPVTATPLFVNPGGGGWMGNGSGGVLMPPPPGAAIPPSSFTVTATDFGVGGAVAQAGLASLPTITETTTGVVFASGSTPAGIPLAETLTPTVYNNRGNAVNDILGNVGTSSGLTSSYGVDLVVLDAEYANGGYATVPAAVANVNIFGGANASIYTTLGAAVAPAALWGPINGSTDLIFVEAIDTRSGLVNPTALTQQVHRFAPAVNGNCYTNGPGGDPLTVIQANNYVQNPLGPATSAAIDCTFGGAVPGAGYYTWTGYVSDRAHNAKKALKSGISLDSVFIAIDGALPNITGIGFQTTLYTGAAPATYSFSANDDLELKDAQITLAYQDPSATNGGVVMNAPVTFPYGSTAYSATPAPWNLANGTFGAPFDNVIDGGLSAVLNGAPLTLNYYVVRYDFGTLAAFVPGAAPSGNVAGFTSSRLNSSVVANIRDVAFQSAAAPLVAPVLTTQIQDRVVGILIGAPAAPTYTTMIDFRITGKSGTHVLTIQDASPSSLSTPFCDRIDIYEAVNAGGVAPAAGMSANDVSLGDAAGDGFRYRATISAASGVLSDNGFQRFFTYTGPVLTPAQGTGLYTAACVKSGSALLSPLF